MDTQLGARHRWRTPTIHRGRARRTIAVRPTGGLQVTSQRSAAGRLAVADDERVGRPSQNKPGKSSSGSSVATNSELHERVIALKLEHLGVRVDDDRLGLEGTGDRELS